MSSFKSSMRTHHCGELHKKHLGEKVVLCGWAHKVRDLGGLLFIDLRDRYGLTQLNCSELNDISKRLSLESVIQIEGVVQERPSEALNSKMRTGEIEVLVSSLEILSHAENPPLLPSSPHEGTEEMKLRYRYLDMRSGELIQNLQKRSQMAQVIRNFLSENLFTEVETPILYKTTPEGARDFLVPSSVAPEQVYALPQSPQTLKQTLMIAGFDRYFQLARCFRDEDLRADRQLEFTQVDIEASFIDDNDMKTLMEGMIEKVFSIDKVSLPTLSYHQVMRDYGSDKPDLRFDLKHHICNEVFKNTTFKVFSGPLSSGGIVKGIFVGESEAKQITRKTIDSLGAIVAPFGLKGVAWCRVQSEEGMTGGISRFLLEEEVCKLRSMQTEDSGHWFFCAHDEADKVHAGADALRRHFGKIFNLIKSGEFKFLWVKDFPLFEYDKEENRFYAKHHPFTRCHPDDFESYKSLEPDALKETRALAYDLVCNGHEIGGGSMRIFNPQEQSLMFKALGMSEEEVKEQFGTFIEALSYGTPPHGGIALGLERLVMVYLETEDIRDVVAFPKTTKGTDLMSNAPTRPSEKQLKDLGLAWMKK